MRWGLIPSWAKDPKMGFSAFNARADNLETKAAFKGAWAKGRWCLILTDGFYDDAARALVTGEGFGKLGDRANSRRGRRAVADLMGGLLREGQRAGGLKGSIEYTS